jgi:hypothetical protein
MHKALCSVYDKYSYFRRTHEFGQNVILDKFIFIKYISIKIDDFQSVSALPHKNLARPSIRSGGGYLKRST